MSAHQDSQPSIFAASIEDIRQDSGDWVFVDIGFAKEANKTCGFARGGSKPKEVNFANMVRLVCEASGNGDGLLNLLIEAPLSVAFDYRGNPTGRRFEKRGSDTRYWYNGLGCSVLTAATYLLFQIKESRPTRQIRLVEGFASFKTQSTENSTHADDVFKLRNVAWKLGDTPGCVIAAEDLMTEGDHLCSAFKVSGMDFGVPPVVMLN